MLGEFLLGMACKRGAGAFAVTLNKGRRHSIGEIGTPAVDAVGKRQIHLEVAVKRHQREAVRGKVRSAGVIHVEVQCSPLGRVHADDLVDVDCLGGHRCGCAADTMEEYGATCPAP